MRNLQRIIGRMDFEAELTTHGVVHHAPAVEHVSTDEGRQRGKSRIQLEDMKADVVCVRNDTFRVGKGHARWFDETPRHARRALA